MAPWVLVWPYIDWYLLELKRKDQIDLVSAFKYHLNKDYKVFIHIYIYIYTDSKKVTGNGVAISAKEIRINRRTSDFLGVNTVEMVAVLVALRWVKKKQDKKRCCCAPIHS